MPEWLMQIGVLIGSCGAIYGGIRADMKAMHEQIKQATESAGEAHKRIDSLLMKGAR